MPKSTNEYPKKMIAWSDAREKLLAKLREQLPNSSDSQIIEDALRLLLAAEQKQIFDVLAHMHVEPGTGIGFERHGDTLRIICSEVTPLGDFDHPVPPPDEDEKLMSINTNISAAETGRGCAARGLVL